MGVIGDIVGNRRDLRLQARPAIQVQLEAGISLGQRPARLRDRSIMLGQSLERFPAKIQSIEIRIGIFEAGQDAQGVGIMIEAPGIAHALTQRILAAMAEWRMAKIMGQA